MWVERVERDLNPSSRPRSGQKRQKTGVSQGVERRNENPAPICCRVRDYALTTCVCCTAFLDAFCCFKDKGQRESRSIRSTLLKPAKNCQKQWNETRNEIGISRSSRSTPCRHTGRGPNLRILLGSMFKMDWKQGLDVCRGRLRTPDSTLSELQVSVHVCGRHKAWQSRIPQATQDQFGEDLGLCADVHGRRKISTQD